MKVKVRNRKTNKTKQPKYTNSFFLLSILFREKDKWFKPALL